MIPHEREALSDSLWTATANPAPVRAPLDGDVAADVAVIGGGYTGLSAALHLAEAGTRVVLLETHQPGWGASGRNGGQINPGLKDGPQAILATFGEDTGGRMIATSGGAADLVFDLIARHGIACDARREGWLRAAHKGAALDDLHGLAREWEAHGAAMPARDAATMARRTGTESYMGGTVDTRGGNLHPLNYALGLAAAAEKAGASIFGGTEVRAMTRRDGRWVLTCDGGRVEADTVILGTNAYSGHIAPDLARSVVPVCSVQVATEPLSDNLAASILPGGQHVSDTRRLLLYYRKDAAGRFVMGGRGTFREASTLRQMARLREVTETLYPQLAGVRWRYRWGGHVAVTPDHYPHLHELAPGLLAGLGYNGRGVAMATAMGRELAGLANGTPHQELGFPVTPVRPLPFAFARGLAVEAASLRMALLDRLGL